MPSADFPSRLGHLISVLPPGHRLTVDRLINDHTLLPLFTPFLHAGRVLTIKHRMVNSRGLNVHGSLGVNTFAEKVKAFRYCPACVVEDRATYGEAYWHRSHHIPGVNLCSTHKVYLMNTDASFRYSKSSVTFITAEAALSGTDLTTVYERNNKLLMVQERLADDAVWLLRNPMFGGYKTNHRNRYVQLFYERRYCTYRGVLDRRKLAEDFIRYYSDAFLEKIQCNVATNGVQDWLTRMAHRRERLIHPIHHLLLIQFLNQTPKSLLCAPDFGNARPAKSADLTNSKPQIITQFSRDPFGTGPWPCLNPVSSHFKQDVVTICEINSTQLHPRRPRGTFRCECGFAYSRVGPDSISRDRYKFDRYVTFGQYWDNALREAVASGACFTEIGRRLQVNHKTLRREMIRLNIKTAGELPITPYRITSYRKKTYQRKELVDRRRLSLKKLAKQRVAKRRKFMRLRYANPELGRGELHHSFAALYSWLYTHDGVWFEKHLPERRRPADKKISRWRERDVELASAVQNEAERIRALPGRPVMVSATSIAHSLGIVNVCTKRPDVLPLTCTALKEFSETPEQLSLRRIEWATAEFQRQRLSASGMRILMLAGVNSRTLKKPAVKAALERAVEYLKLQMDLDYSCLSAA